MRILRIRNARKGSPMEMRTRAALFIVLLAGVGAASAACARRTADVFYAIAETGSRSKLIRIEARGVNDVAVREVGPTGAVGCTALAGADDGGLFSVCGLGTGKPGPQRLTTIDHDSGHAATIGQQVDGLQIMGLKFGPDGKLYTVGDTNPASPTFNSLYSVDAHTGAVTRIGSTGAPSFFHDFAVDGKGTTYATSSDSLYTIDLKTGTASRVAKFVGGGMVMGLSFNADRSKLYAADWKEPASDLYLVDVRTGFLTPLASTGYALVHGLTSASH